MQIFWLRSKILPGGHLGIKSHKLPFAKYPYLQLQLTPDYDTMGSELGGHLNGRHAFFHSLQTYPSWQMHLVFYWFKVENAGHATQLPLTKRKLGLHTHFLFTSSYCSFWLQPMQTPFDMNWPSTVQTHLRSIRLKTEFKGHCGICLQVSPYL